MTKYKEVSNGLVVVCVMHKKNKLFFYMYTIRQRN